MTLSLALTGNRELMFSVAGPPIPQGSKSSRIVGKSVRVNGRVAIIDPRVVLIEQSDMKSKTRPSGRLTRWRQRIAQCAVVAMDSWTVPAFRDHVELSVEFVLPRPPSHYTSTGKLKRAAPPYPGKPDLSKLVRAVEDALTGVAYTDDAMIAAYGPVSKRYASRGKMGGAVIKVRGL